MLTFSYTGEINDTLILLIQIRTEALKEVPFGTGILPVYLRSVLKNKSDKIMDGKPEVF